jgi:hypothetical protein
MQNLQVENNQLSCWFEMTDDSVCYLNLTEEDGIMTGEAERAGGVVPCVFVRKKGLVITSVFPAYTISFHVLVTFIVFLDGVNFPVFDHMRRKIQWYLCSVFSFAVKYIVEKPLSACGFFPSPDEYPAFIVGS